jgi:effector-binding domain-containing protein
VETVCSNSSFAEAGPLKAVVGARYGREAARRHLEQALAEECELKTLAPRLVLMMRFRAPASELPRAFFRRYESMLQYLEQQGQAPVGHPFAIYDNIDDNAADVQAGFVIESDVAASGDMIVTRLPGATVAALTHEGAYENIEPSYFKLLQWAHERGLTRSGRFMETYSNSPIDTPDSELRTQIMVPVGPQSANDQ